MANSSDWIAAMERGADAEPRGWMAQLPVPSAFVEGAPYAPRACATEEPASEPACEPVSDPTAEAFARGEEAGRQAAAREHEATGEHQRALRLSLRSFDQAALDSLASEMLETVIALCSQVLEDFAADPDQLLVRCAEAARRLGGAASDCALHLHPEDVALIDPASLDGWRVVPDDTIARGGLRLEGPDGSISDGPAEWRRAIAAAIRGELRYAG
ncbi:MAG: FliH/SctL family protein [Erythrobacter sp.]